MHKPSLEALLVAVMVARWLATTGVNRSFDEIAEPVDEALRLIGVVDEDNRWAIFDTRTGIMGASVYLDRETCVEDAVKEGDSLVVGFHVE